eukprot:864425-Amphidinium_carterae.1
MASTSRTSSHLYLILETAGCRKRQFERRRNFLQGCSIILNIIITCGGFASSMRLKSSREAFMRACTVQHTRICRPDCCNRNVVHSQAS